MVTKQLYNILMWPDHDLYNCNKIDLDLYDMVRLISCII